MRRSMIRTFSTDDRQAISWNRKIKVCQKSRFDMKQYENLLDHGSISIGVIFFKYFENNCEIIEENRRYIKKFVSYSLTSNSELCFLSTHATSTVIFKHSAWSIKESQETEKINFSVAIDRFEISKLHFNLGNKSKCRLADLLQIARGGHS